MLKFVLLQDFDHTCSRYDHGLYSNYPCTSRTITLSVRLHKVQLCGKSLTAGQGSCLPGYDGILSRERPAGLVMNIICVKYIVI
jgi:hypothetical protein